VHPTRVLIVDDDPPIRQMLSDVLAAEGYLVSEAANGRQALDVLACERPDAIVLDSMMPVMDGGTFVRHYYAQLETHPVPIILTSASPGLRQSAEQLRPFGVRDCIAKPFDLSRLLEVVARLAEPAGLLAAAL
jgi:two-component system response regulator MprA